MITLYKVDSNDKLRIWICEEDYEGRLVINSGLEDGQLVETIVDVVTNNSNRELWEQVELEYDSRVAKQLRLGYCKTKHEAINAPKFECMKAHKYKDHMRKVDLVNCAIQPKLDGLRMTAHKEDGNITMWSRGRKRFTTLQHIRKELDSIMQDGEIFDGELFLLGIPLQTINSWCRRKQPNTKLIEYHVYDSVSSESFWKRRPTFNDTEHVKLVKTHVVTSHAGIDEFRLHYCGLGYEGVMVRNTSMAYEMNRSYGLLKYKLFMDREYLIADVTAPVIGEDKDCAILVCITDDGQTFKTIPKGTKKYRREIFLNKFKYIGHDATVRFAGFSNDGIPVPNPVTILIDRKGLGDL